MLAAIIIIGAVAIALIVIGYLIGVKKKITLLHDYHYTNVSNDKKGVFCSLSGLGIAFIGVGLLVTAVMLAISDSALSFIAFGVGFVLGIALLIYAGNKYN